MVSKAKLKSELQTFNDDLDKHMKKVDFDELTSPSTDFNFSKSLESREHAILFSENLKEIRYEINMMRKNMTSDVGVMVAKEIDKLKSGFFNDLMTAQNQLFEHIRSIDLTPLKVLQEEVESIKNQHLSLDSSISDLKEEFHKQLISANTHQEKRTSAILEEFKLSQSALLKKMYSLESSFTSTQNHFASQKSALEHKAHNLIENSKKAAPQVSASSSSSAEFENHLKELHQKSDEQLHAFEDKMHQTKFYLENTPHLSSATGEISFEQNSRSTPSREEFEVGTYNSKPAQRILSIDEKLRRLNELR